MLPTEDADISKLAERALQEAGHRGPKTADVRRRASTAQEADWVVIAAGRGPDVEGLGLDAAGVKLDERGLIAVDGALRTNVPRVYAIGDLVPGPALAHKASDEGVIAVEDAAGQRDPPDRLRRHPARDVLHARTSPRSA